MQARLLIGPTKLASILMPVLENPNALTQEAADLFAGVSAVERCSLFRVGEPDPNGLAV
jgi:hypothetical protein